MSKREYREKPLCFTPNGDTYPLCNGKDNNKKCENCCLCVNQQEGYNPI